MQSNPCAESQLWEEKWDRLVVWGSDFNNQASNFQTAGLKSGCLIHVRFCPACVTFYLFFSPFSFVFVVTFAKQIQACSCCSNGWLNQDSLLVFSTPHRVIVCAFSINFDF